MVLEWNGVDWFGYGLLLWLGLCHWDGTSRPLDSGILLQHVYSTTRLYIFLFWLLPGLGVRVRRSLRLTWSCAARLLLLLLILLLLLLLLLGWASDLWFFAHFAQVVGMRCFFLLSSLGWCVRLSHLISSPLISSHVSLFKYYVLIVVAITDDICFFQETVSLHTMYILPCLLCTSFWLLA